MRHNLNMTQIKDLLKLITDPDFMPEKVNKNLFHLLEKQVDEGHVQVHNMWQPNNDQQNVEFCAHSLEKVLHESTIFSFSRAQEWSW